LVLLLILVSAVFFVLYSRKTETPKNDVNLTQPEVSANEVADEALREWMDENEEVQIGEII